MFLINIVLVNYFIKKLLFNGLDNVYEIMVFVMLMHPSSRKTKANTSFELFFHTWLESCALPSAMAEEVWKSI